MELYLVLLGIFLIGTSGLSLQLFFKNKTQLKGQKEITLTLFRMLIPSAIISSFSLYLSEVGSFAGNATTWSLGALFLVMGIFLRWYAVLRLKHLFTVQLAIQKNHQLIRTGLFKYIRHPSYLGMISYFIGLGFLMHNYWSFAVLLALPLAAIFIRIRAEEALLLSFFKEEYREYQQQSARLIPFLY